MILSQELNGNFLYHCKLSYYLSLHQIGKISKKPVYFKKKPSLAGAPKNISLSTKKYEDEFGKLKLLKIKDGLKKTIEWCIKL